MADTGNMSERTIEKPTEKLDDIESIHLVRERFSESESAWDENRKRGLDDDQHINGEQWPEAIQKERQQDGRPCLTINHLPGFIDQVVGDQRQNRPRIKVRPVDDQSDPETAETIEGLIRNIEYTSHADSAYDTAFEHAVNHGFGYFRILKDYAGPDTFNQDLKITRIKNSYSVYPDPYAQEADLSDMEYCFITEIIQKKEFKRRFPDASWSHDFESSKSGNAYEGWFMTDKVRIAEYWTRKPIDRVIVQLSNGIVMAKADATPEKLMELATPISNPVTGTVVGMTDVTIVKERTSRSWEVNQYIVSGYEIIEGPKRWEGEHIPIIAVLGKELIVDGKTILRGVIRNAKDPQRMYNFWRSAVTEVIALAPKTPFLATPEQVEGHETIWSTAHRKSYGYLPYNHTGAPMPQRQQPSTIPTGAFTEAQAAVDDMKATTGIYDASLGAKSNETSGKAIMVRQREGDVATFVFIDNLSRAIQHAGRILVQMIPKVYDTERLIRIINIDGTDKSIPINKTGQDVAGLPIILNDITVGKYDVVVEAGPSYTTQRQETAESILGFMQATPTQAPLMADLAAKNMDWPDAQEISARLKKSLPPGLTEPNENKSLPEPQPDPQILLEQEKLKLEFAKIELEKFKIEAELEKERLKFAGMQSGMQYSRAPTPDGY